jgi:hypothetical protein
MRLSPPSLYSTTPADKLQLQLTTPSTTSLYNSALQSQLPITVEDPPTKSTTTTVYQDYLRLQSRELRGVSFQELLILCKNTSLPQPLLRCILVNKENIIVLKP